MKNLNSTSNPSMKDCAANAAATTVALNNKPTIRINGKTYYWVSRTIDHNCNSVYIAVREGNLYKITFQPPYGDIILGDISLIADLNSLINL